MNNTTTVGKVRSEIDALERNYKDVTDIINAMNKAKVKLDVPFEPVMVLMDVRTRLETIKNALKRELDDTEVTSDLFYVVR